MLSTLERANRQRKGRNSARFVDIFAVVSSRRDDIAHPFNGRSAFGALKRGVDLISDVLPFGRLWHAEPNAISNAVGYAKFFSRSHDAVIRVYVESGAVIETHEQTGDFQSMVGRLLLAAAGTVAELVSR